MFQNVFTYREACGSLVFFVSVEANLCFLYIYGIVFRVGARPAVSLRRLAQENSKPLPGHLVSGAYETGVYHLEKTLKRAGDGGLSGVLGFLTTTRP